MPYARNLQLSTYNPQHPTRLGSLQAESAIDKQDLTGNEIGIIGGHE
jgi:hypothetical protein